MPKYRITQHGCFLFIPGEKPMVFATEEECMEYYEEHYGNKKED